MVLSDTGAGLVDCPHAVSEISRLDTKIRKNRARRVSMYTPTQFAGRILLCCAVVAAPAFALAQEAEPAKPAVGTQLTHAAKYGKLLSGMEKEGVDAAEAMPEDKFNLAPATGEFKGVRS